MQAREREIEEAIQKVFQRLEQDEREKKEAKSITVQQRIKRLTREINNLTRQTKE
jgi:hypothetical protein